MLKKLLFLIGTGCSVLSFSQTDEVLFIGNSVTYFNDMPEIFKNIAASKGKNVSITTHTPGGTGFVNHVDDPLLYQKIRSKNYKYVIMQPGTAESAGHSYPVTVTAERGRKIRDSIRKYSPCSQIFLYEIPYGVPSANEYNTYFAFQQKIKDSITKMSNLMQVEMVPAGESARVISISILNTFPEEPENRITRYFFKIPFLISIFKIFLCGISKRGFLSAESH